MGMIPTEMQEVDFVVLSEDYSRFLVHDGTIIKAKIVVRKIFFTPQRSPEGYPLNMGFDSINAVAAIVPPALKGKPSNEPFNPQEAGMEMKFEEQEVKTQEYMTTNGFRISMKPLLTKVFRYNKMNAFGEPVYNVIVQAVTNIHKIETTAT